MSDEATPFYGVTIQTYILGDSYNFRAVDGEGIKTLVSELAENANEIADGLSTFKQAVVAKVIVTNDKERGAAKSTPSSGRKSDAGPPDDGDSPRCEHGAMKDLKDRGYKNRWYCAAPKGDKQCPSRP